MIDMNTVMCVACACVCALHSRCPHFACVYVCIFACLAFSSCKYRGAPHTTIIEQLGEASEEDQESSDCAEILLPPFHGRS